MTNRITALATELCQSADVLDKLNVIGPQDEIRRAAELLDQIAPLDDLDMPCVKMVACPGPKNGCYGMHMGHRCPDCNGTGQATPAVKLRKLIAVWNAVQSPFAVRRDFELLREIGKDA